MLTVFGLQALDREPAISEWAVIAGPPGVALGMVQQLPDADQTSVSRRQLLARLDVCMGGRLAEELIFGAAEVTTGASHDLDQARARAGALGCTS